MKVIQITRGDTVREFPVEDLHKVCVILAGGGYSTAQTMKAMTIKAQLERGEAVTTRKFKALIVEEFNK